MGQSVVEQHRTAPNLVPLRWRRRDRTIAAPPPALDQKDLDQLALQTTWLHALFESLELLDRGLGKLETCQAMLPASPALQKLQTERSRLSCELFQLRMAAVKLSGQLAQLRQGSRPAP